MAEAKAAAERAELMKQKMAIRRQIAKRLARDAFAPPKLQKESGARRSRTPGADSAQEQLEELLSDRREHSAQLSELYELARRGRALAAAAPAAAEPAAPAVAEITATLRPYERELQLKQSVIRSLEYRSAARDALSGTKSQALVEAWNAQPMLAELPEPDRDG